MCAITILLYCDVQVSLPCHGKLTARSWHGHAMMVAFSFSGAKLWTLHVVFNSNYSSTRKQANLTPATYVAPKVASPEQAQAQQCNQ